METKDAAVRDELYEEAQLLRRRQQDYKSELVGLPAEGSSLPVVGSCDIEAVVSAWSNIPVERMTEDEMSKLVNLVGGVDRQAGVITGRQAGITTTGWVGQSSLVGAGGGCGGPVGPV
jgi:ATP-dependent Clp protease ATP-binding subunit ClpA